LKNSKSAIINEKLDSSIKVDNDLLVDAEDIVDVSIALIHEL